jgi:signal transduction histidine kinase
LRLIEAQATEKGVETRVEAQSNLTPVMADKDTLRSVFTNLVINGLQAIDGEGGNIVIRIVNDEGGRTLIEVSDTGRGIAPDDISKVFEPYYSTKETGTGLGLAIVRKVIEDHGGTVSVRSKLGGGTTFTILLPPKSDEA